MDLIDYLITNIANADQLVRWPGIFLIVLYLLKAFGHLFRLRLISVITNVLYALVIALIIARYGDQIAQYLYGLIEQYQAKNSDPS